MLTGDNGILQKAADATVKTEKAQIIENAQTDILEQLAENKGTNITKGQLVEILNTYFKPTAETSIPDEISITNDLVLTTIDDKYNINLSQVYTGSFVVEQAKWTYNHDTQTVTNGSNTLHIGEYVKYNIPSGQSYSGKWGVLGADKEGNLLIASSQNIVSSCDLKDIYTYIEPEEGKTQGKFLDRGKDVLDAQISSYLNTEVANSIRCMTVEDINTITGYDPEHEGYNKYTNTSNLGISYSATGVDRYKNNVTYTLDKYNGMYYQGTTAYTNRERAEDIKDFRLPGQSSGSNTSPYTVESTGYKYYPDTLKDSSEGTTTGIRKTESEDDKYSVMPYNLLFTNGSGNRQSYWLATPFAKAGYGNVLWGYFAVSSGSVYVYDIWSSRAGQGYPPMDGVRAVVSIKTTTTVELDSPN